MHMYATWIIYKRNMLYKNLQTKYKQELLEITISLNLEAVIDFTPYKKKVRIRL